jgi:hypothetical protein
MSALFFALALFAAQDQAAPSAEPAPAPAEAAPAAAEPEEPPYPPGAPRDDYGLVSWCYGALAGYLDLHDKMIPEVTRIEDAFRRPGTTLADDMKTYSDMQKISKTNMKLFARAMEAAERASIQPINTRGAEAVRKGRAGWAAAASLPTRTVAQQWMGWALPARCTPTATTLETRAKLMGTAFKANEIPAAEPAPDAAPESPPTSDSAQSPQAPVESPPTHP